MLPREHEDNSEMLVRDDAACESRGPRLKVIGIRLDCAVIRRHEPSSESPEDFKNTYCWIPLPEFLVQKV